MKTRSNMPLFVVECNNVKTLSNAQIDLLRCGDYLVKKDESGEHAYKVTFKSDTGLCLTYHDASVIETQSYDKIDGVWTYNSEDKNDFDFSNKDIVAKTLKQTQANYSLDLSELEVSGLNTGVDYDIVYGKIEVINGVLYMVLSIALENTTETNIVLTNPSISIILDNDEVADKIIDFSGVSVNKTTSTDAILGINAVKGSTAYPTAMNTEFKVQCSNMTTKNAMQLTLFGLGTINAGTTMYFSIRTFLTIL